jgi:uncharacterized phage protein (TIGR02218 family)
MSAEHWLAEPLVAAAWCWRMERSDGFVAGLTSHDRDLVIGGLLYRAAPGMRPSRIEQSDGIEAQSIDLTGAITSTAITAADIAAGRWDGARLTLFIAAWDDLDAPVQDVARGTLGEVTRKGDAFSAELTGPLTGLDQPVGVIVSPTCRAVFGGKACGVALAPLTQAVKIVAVSGQQVTVTGLAPASDLVRGTLRWLDGSACGMRAAIVRQDGAVLTLSEMPATPMILPARAEVRAGCDKRLGTCAERFANAVNFRGEAHVPGFDLLTRYPGG